MRFEIRYANAIEPRYFWHLVTSDGRTLAWSENYRTTAGRDAATTAEQTLGRPVAVAVNASNSGHPYLTLYGSSAEAGDDGQVGRGNRFGGLITPGRPMSLEACAGKNPVAHVGKTYHAVAHDIAEDVLAQTGAGEVTVTMNRYARRDRAQNDAPSRRDATGPSVGWRRMRVSQNRFPKAAPGPSPKVGSVRHTGSLRCQNRWPRSVMGEPVCL